MGQSIHATQALTPAGWRADIRLTVRDGVIATVETEVPAQAGDEKHAMLLPGIANLHSHAFQRGMAGLAEVRGIGPDTFWTWREVMYRFALAMNPAQAEAIAAQAYVEMLESGFTRVGEFHYLHHDTDGRPYLDIGEMAASVAAASVRTGIALTLLPVFYAHSNFGGVAPTQEQRRFVSSRDGFERLVARCRAILKTCEAGVLGIAPHSLRAVTPEELAAVSILLPDAPVHIHLAEQVREVEDCQAWSGARPVQWLLDHAPVDERWCAIHATHMTDAEARALAGAGAVAGLCPVTEANLGDGFFNLRPFIERGGRLGIGSDSNVMIGVVDELRQLEYAQRLHARARNILAPEGGSTGRALVEAAFDGGAALGAGRSGLTAGARADLVSFRPGPAASVSLNGDPALDAWIFTRESLVVDCVWVGGRKQVQDGRHHARDDIHRRFRAVMDELT